MRSLSLTALSLTLGFFFVFVGLLKVTPKVNPEIHRHLQLEFGRYNKGAFPFYNITGWKPYAKNYRLAAGILEVLCGAILILIPGRAKEFANVLLLVIMGVSLWTHYTLKDQFDKMAPSLVFSSLLFCRLMISYQVEKRERLEYANAVLRAMHHEATLAAEEREKTE